ncbi:MAG: DNA repair protein RadA [Candidatus Magasanikbacteria bacterium RIFCSPHIGHO2_02_FULL_41_13]|uniref:DNA repair protein RadA n=1 Tax=Candidatus Magasanikbacteria bacterium RIFCSPHIGHO2_02_FULL_41_13 TaxID=1798676 RepID=A0A1F6M5R5_9BACT|nr:MAG: DNA repair protein RadA [Candidatus Magasanikbacteria bacterium RIFCSPHIGHO2_02_FULL_41_13]
MKETKMFACSHCGAQYQKWVGRCLECGKWGTIAEQALNEKPSPSNKSGKTFAAAKTIKLSDIQSTQVQRMQTKSNELNRVLGGGLVPGSFILLGGEPGIGKSTLSIQIASMIPQCLYISGEESVEQIKLRADRLKLETSTLHLLNETHLETILATIDAVKSPLVIIDSIQTMYTSEVDGEPGNVSQLRACAVKLLEAAKSTNTAIVLIGHVTKDGTVAGPRTLEHLVDTVLYLEGDRYHDIRILRTVKNRFGSTDEVGMFEMNENGLIDVANPSAMLLAERGDTMPGSVVTCLTEGTRSLLVEVQALITKTSFGYPVRKASGFDLNRLHVLIAVLQRRAALNLAQYDVHINIVGGVVADEPAADLAICLAIASAYKDKALGNDLAVFGEVGLGGEIRSVRFLEKRIKECENLGMKRIITTLGPKGHGESKKVKIINVKNIDELIKHT